MNQDSRDLLVEVGTEELPPKSLKTLSEAFGANMEKGLSQAGLAHGTIHLYATPRRLAITIEALVTAQAHRTIERRGPALSAAFNDDGEATAAALGFARSCGVAVEQLEKLENEQGAWLLHRTKHQGRATVELLPDIVESALGKLPTPRRMRWGTLNVEFVRPVHWLVILLGDQPVAAHILGIHSGRETRGHRFHHPQPLYLSEPLAYAPLLETEGHVVVDFSTRREAIRAQAMEAAANVGGAAIIDEDLLDEVTGLVEWPVAVLGDFDPNFLEVPAEALISAMKGHQKYFHMVDKKNRLMPHFIAISNIDGHDMNMVRVGNQRVIRPRLADADFFWKQDRKTRLAQRADALKSVVFQAQLGTLYDKTNRIAALAGYIAEQLGGDEAKAKHAGYLSKCDLMTAMVGEFPELQGIMGRHYAIHDGEPQEVAQAIDEQYMPRFAGDVLPHSTTGQCLAIADKLDTLVGVFAIKQIPSGDKDPFALRRAALGVLRIIIEQRLALDLHGLLGRATDGYDNLPDLAGVSDQVFAFMMERLRAYYLDMGIGHDVFEAVLARQPTCPYDFDQRLRAVSAFRELPDADSLTSANKRIHNILRQAQGQRIPDATDNSRLEQACEKTLAQRVAQLRQEIAPHLESGDYTQALTRLAGLRKEVDDFFDTVMVMTDNVVLRENRLALLSEVQALFLGIAELSKLQG